MCFVVSLPVISTVLFNSDSVVFEMLNVIQKLIHKVLLRHLLLEQNCRVSCTVCWYQIKSSTTGVISIYSVVIISTIIHYFLCTSNSLILCYIVIILH